MVREAHRQWESGAAVNLMWHAAPPNQDRTCGWDGGILSRLTDAEWEDLVTDGGALEREWRARMDEIVPYLEWLAERGVAVLFRPLHEMNQEKFWWGGRPGPDGSARLWRRTRDYFAGVRGLDHLVWTWDVQDLRFDWEGYHPGDGAFDLLAVDMYQMGYTDALYREALRLSGGRPIAVGEAAVLPTPEDLARQPRWAFAMGWSDLAFERSPPERLRALAESDRVLTLERMPGWSGYCSSSNLL
jgi:mannan endo-1,4-beta-mannosidase